MYHIDKYLSNIKALTNSLVIKINEIPYVVNQSIKDYAGYDFKIDDPSKQTEYEWKYYLNLAGKMHRLDTKIYINVLETETKEVLTAELLDQYPTTKNELLKYGKFYDQLLAEYPEYLRYIHGCMQPIDMDLAINAEQGTILSYNKKFIEDNEYYLIPELEDYIKKFLNRWHVRAYTIADDLYIPSLLAALYSGIYLKIINLKLSRIGTFQVDSFHLEHFFRSHLDIWDDIKILNNESIFWLYKNQDVMMHNVGREKTFEKIYKKLFALNGIGIGEYRLRRTNPVYAEDNQNLSIPSYVNPDVEMYSKQLNEFYTVNDNQERPIDGILQAELENLKHVNKNVPVTFKNWIRHVATETINKKYLEEQKTKVLDIEAHKLNSNTSLDIFSLLMDWWAYILKEGKASDEPIEFSGNVVRETEAEGDGGSSETIEEGFTITFKTGFLMLLKLLLKSVNKTDTKITGVNFTQVTDLDKTRYSDVITSVPIEDGYSYAILRTYQDFLPVEPATFLNQDDTGTFLNDVIEFSKYLWIMMANTQDWMITQNVKRVFGVLAKHGTYELTKTPKTIDQLLAEQGIVYEIESFVNIPATIKKLVRVCTGVQLDEEDIILNQIEKYKEILYKLTSYSLHVIDRASNSKDIVVYYNTPTVLATKNGLVLNYGVIFKGLEDPFGVLNALSYPVENWTHTDIIRYQPQLAYDYKIEGDMILHNEQPVKEVPYIHYTADFITKPVYNFRFHKGFNDFITLVTPEFNALENPIMDITTRYTKEDQLSYGRFIRDHGTGRYLSNPEGDLVLADPQNAQGLIGEGYNTSFDVQYKTLGIDSYAHSDYYTHIGLMAFKVMGNDDNDDRLVTYISDDALNVELDIIAGVSSTGFREGDKKPYIHSKDLLDKLDLVAPDPTAIKPAVHKPFRYSRETIYNNDHPDWFKDKVDATISLADAVGLASIPFRLQDGGSNKLSKLMYIGLINIDGDMDIYDVSGVQITNFTDVLQCPIVRTTPYIFKGTGLPLKGHYGTNVLTVNVDLASNLKLNPSDLSYIKNINESFINYNNVMVGEFLEVAYNSGDSKLLEIAHPDKPTTANKFRIFQYHDNSILVETLKVYVYSDTYVRKDDIPLNISPKVEGFYQRAKKKKYFEEDLVKYFGINDVLFKAKVTELSYLRINNYIKYINAKLNEYVFPNGLCLYINGNTVLEIDPYNKTLIAYEVESIEPLDIETYIRAEEYNLDVPNYIIDSSIDMSTINIGNMSAYHGFYQVGKIVYKSLTDTDFVSQEAIEKTITDAYGNNPWKQDTND